MAPIRSKFTTWTLLIQPLIFVPFIYNDFMTAVGDSEKVLWRFIAHIVFFNSLHVANTFMLFLLVPEFNEWQRLHLGRRRWFWIAGPVIFVLLYVISQDRSATLGQWAFILIMILSVWHALKQQLGLSLLMSYRQQNETSTVTRGWAEKWAFRLLFLLSSAHLTLGQWREGAEWQAPISVLAGMEFCIVVGLLTLSLRQANIEKAFFLSRLFFYPLSAFSFVGYMAILASHGFEYLLFTSRIVTSSKWKAAARPFWALNMFCLIVVMTGSLLSSNSGILALMSVEWPRAKHVLAIGLGAVTYFHYLLDMELYKMKNRDSQRLIGPLAVAGLG